MNSLSLIARSLGGTPDTDAGNVARTTGEPVRSRNLPRYICPVSSYSFHVPGAVLDARVVTQIGEIVRPYSLPYYEHWKAHPYNPPSKEVTEPVTVDGVRTVDEVIADGGTYRTRSWSITETSGVVHASEYGEFPFERLNDFSRAAFVFDAPPYGPSAPSVAIDANDWGISATIQAEPDKIGTLSQDVRNVLESAIDQEKIRALLPAFKVFIGHGGDRKWEVVRDYISDAGYEIESFESFTRAGEMTLAVVEQMISRSTVAVVVMTGVDVLKDGRVMARQNVVHEIGLAQGLLGISNTIVLLENGTEEFTNISGLTQIRFPVGEIHVTKPEVLATLANHARRLGYPQA
jgi:predicted nucleotide-binding protein